MEPNDPELLSELRRDEGEVRHEYKDSLGFSTIGVGRLIDKRKGGGLSSDEISYLLANDVKRTIADLDKHLPWWRQLTAARQRVLINMAFNLGIGSAAVGSGLLGFKNTLRMVQEGDYAGAAAGMLSSKWAKQVGARAERLAKMMKEG
jgi:lysozyme